MQDTTKTKKINKANTLTFPQIKRYNEIIEWQNEVINEHQVSFNVVQALDKYNIIFQEDIADIECSTTKEYLLKIGDNIVFYLPRYVYEGFEQIFAPRLQQTNSDLEVAKYLHQLRSFGDECNIPKFSDKDKIQINWLLLAGRNLKTGLEHLPFGTYVKSVIAKTLQSLEGIGTNTSILNASYEVCEEAYYHYKIWEINNNNWIDYSTSTQEKLIIDDPKKKYQFLMHFFHEAMEYEKEVIQSIRYSIYESQKTRGIKRTNAYFESLTPYKKELTIYDIENVTNNTKRILQLLEREAPIEHAKLQEIANNGEDAIKSSISIIVGKTLSKNASIALKAFTALAYRDYYFGKIPNLSSKISVKASEFWQLCNIIQKDGKPHSRSKTVIQEVIEEELRKDIIYKDNKSYFITSFILNFSWENNHNFTFQIDDMFLVYDEAEKFSYYYSDLEGCNRLMKKMNNSDAAYWLHHYLEHSIKKTVHPFNFSVLLEQARLTERYKIAKTRTITLLYNILDAMVSEHTLIYDWKHIPSSSDTDGKIELYNLVYKDKVTSLKTSKKN